MNIHLLEKKLDEKYNKNKNNPYIYGRISYTTDERFKLNKKWFKYFTMESSFGDLRMNYATNEKSLGHLYEDDDLIYLKE